MITTLLFDFSRTILFPKDEAYKLGLNRLYGDEKGRHEFTFDSHFVFNEQLLSYIKTIKDMFGIYIFTSGSVQNDPESRRILDPLFRGIYSAASIGISKADPAAYTYVLEDIGARASETVFIDDLARNIEAARHAGLHTILYEDYDAFQKQLLAIIN